MKKIFCVLFPFALCVWCAGGVAAVDEERRVEVASVGGYAVMADSVAAPAAGAVPCPPESAPPKGTCTDANTEDEVVGSGTCGEEGRLGSCGPAKDQGSCKGSPPKGCPGSKETGADGLCAEKVGTNCTTSSAVEPKATPDPGDVEVAGPEDFNKPPCKDGQTEKDGACVPGVDQSQRGGSGEHIDRGIKGTRGEPGPPPITLKENEKKERDSSVERCDTTKPGKCTGSLTNSLPDSSEPQPSTPLQPQTDPATAPGGTSNNGKAIDGNKGQQTAPQNTSHTPSGGGGSTHEKTQEEKNEEAKKHADTNNGQGNSASEVSGTFTSTNGGGPGSDASPPSEHNTEAASAAEDHSNSDLIQASNIHSAGKENDSVQSSATSMPSSSSAPADTISTTSSSPVPEEAKDTKNADSSVSPVWVHAPLLLLTLFAVTAVS
ncbi:hypothetical protein DQ04_07351010 [Trypanosoma grayi]|uniref:hypothetical protein n=1 Tax=Trypanosoma grayi TaxID=71804 RepID=UPI0004F43F52|nr:hypothetical protein DQ04_07351010 [Trypanosoma grayi]KEG08368.1 hypothetical protein DQ04_07351010 [Trypanosoma grayi]